MASLVIRPFRPEDYTALAPPGWTVGAGPAYTATVDGEVAGCAGVALAGPGYGAWGTAWALLGPLAHQHPRFVVLAVADGLARICQEHRLVRVEADVLADFPRARRWVEWMETPDWFEPYADPAIRARRWVEWMGFTEESQMPLRGPGGSTMVRYVIFPKDDGKW